MRVSTGPAGSSASLSYDTKSTKQYSPVAAVQVRCRIQEDGGPNGVKEMFIALIKRDNMAGLADHIDLLKDRHALAMGKLAKKAWVTAMKGINHHRTRIRTAVMEVLADARADTHVVANKVAEKVLGMKSIAPFLNIRSDHLKPLALSAPNPKMASIWETEESYMQGFRSVLQNGTGLDTVFIEELFSFLSEFS